MQAGVPVFNKHVTTLLDNIRVSNEYPNSQTEAQVVSIWNGFVWIVDLILLKIYVMLLSMHLEKVMDVKHEQKHQVSPPHSVCACH